MSFVFYDTETTGVDTAFDQILQFGAVRTDVDLTPVDRFEVRCRLLPRVVPHPRALVVTGTGVDRLTDPALPTHYQMMRAIHERLTTWAPAVFIGYNSINFDEHLLRSALWKTLHPPYLTNTNGNTRTDAMKLVQAVMFLRPSLLVIPVGGNGRPILKLDAVAPANGFAHSRAHDALGDVEATIYICRLVAERAPEIWSDFMRFAQKAAALDFLQDEPAFGLIETHYGKTSGYMLSMIGQNAANPNEIYAYNLSVDPLDLAALPDEALAARLSRSPAVVKKVKVNSAPVLTSADELVAAAQQKVPTHDELRRRLAELQQDPQLVRRLTSILDTQAATPKERSPHIEQQIYDGFSPREDAAKAQAFHVATPEERRRLVEEFEDQRLRVLARRLIYDETPAHLSEAERAAEERLIAERLLADSSDLPWCTLPAALASCRELLADADQATRTRLLEYLAYCEERLAQLRTHTTPTAT